MSLIEMVASDSLRGLDREITLRFDPENVIELPCQDNYDSTLTRIIKKESKVARVITGVQFNFCGFWRIYPSVTWLSDVEFPGQLETKALIKLIDSEVIIMRSHPGFPDGELFDSARKAGVYTKIITGKSGFKILRDFR